MCIIRLDYDSSLNQWLTIVSTKIITSIHHYQDQIAQKQMQIQTSRFNNIIQPPPSFSYLIIRR